MLQPGDEDLASRDRAIPGLATVLDQDALADALRPHLPGPDMGPIHLSHVRYRPGSDCIATYRRSAAGNPVAFYAKAHASGGRWLAKHRRGREDDRRRSHIRRIVLDDLRVLVSLFPHDARLPAVARFADAEAGKDLLRTLVPNRPELWDGTLESLTYKPEWRYVARLRGSDGSSALLKLYTEGGFRTADRAATALVSRGRLHLAERVGRCERNRAQVMEWLAGQSLDELIADDDGEPRDFAAVGAALAEFHSQRGTSLTSRTRQMEAAIWRTVAHHFVYLCPHLAGEAERLAGQLCRWLAAEPPLSHPIHGDFYAKQVLLSGGQVAIVDLDAAALGDPRADLGLFVAHLERDALFGRFAADQVGNAKEALLDGYGGATGRALPSGIEPYVAAGLFQLAHEPFRYRQPEWPAVTAALLERGGAILAVALHPPRSGRVAVPMGNESQDGVRTEVPVVDPYGVTADPEMAFLATALDPNEATRELQHLPLTSAGHQRRVELHTIRVRRHKPGRRCLIEYQLVVEDDRGHGERLDVLGKARFEGVSVTQWRLANAFREAGFVPDSPDRIAVPRPVGIVPRFHMWLQEKVGGEPAMAVLTEAGGVALARRLATAIHKVHRAGIPPTRHHSIADELRVIEDDLANAARLRPEWGARLDRLRDACRRVAATVPKTERRGIHRDSRPGHVRVAGDVLYLLNFALYCEGDPCLDVGNFLAHLTMEGTNRSGNPDALADREAGLEEGFLQLSRKATHTAIQAYKTLTLVRHVCLNMASSEGWPLATALLDLCEERLAIGTRLSPKQPIP